MGIGCFLPIPKILTSSCRYRLPKKWILVIIKGYSSGMHVTSLGVQICFYYVNHLSSPHIQLISNSVSLYIEIIMT